MLRRFVMCGLLLTLTLSQAGFGADKPAVKQPAAPTNAGLEKMKTLAGTWLAADKEGKATDQVASIIKVTAGGSVVTFEVKGGKRAAFAFMDALEIVDISNNLGDSKSLITHPATTTHRAMGEEGRAKAGVTDGMIRLSVGLESPTDIERDVARGLAAAAAVG